MVLLNAIQGVLSIILMIAIGYILSYRGWFDSKSSKLISRLVVSVSLPAYMIANLMGQYDRDKLIHLVSGSLVPFASMGICYIIGLFIARMIRIAPNRRGTFCSMFSLSNTIFVGLPVNLALFGEESISFVLLYYIANTTLFWTIGVYGISSDGGSNDKKLFSASNIKRIFSPPLTAFLLAIIMILIGIKLPKSILDTCKYMGNLTTPLSMLFIGIVMQSVNLKQLKLDRSILALLLGRFIIAPAVVISICIFLPIPPLMKKVFVIQSAMPAMTQTSIIAETYNADYKYAAVATTITTVASLLSIPLYMLLLNSVITG